MTASLFESPQPAVSEQRRPAQPKVRDKLLVRHPEVKHGAKDKNGKYWYEYFHEYLDKHDEKTIDAFVKLIHTLPDKSLQDIKNILTRYMASSICEQDNFFESIGR